MKKLWAVFKREYIVAVRKKMFIVMTVLMPLLMVGMFVLPNMIMMRGLGEKKVAVLDGTGGLGEVFTRPRQPLTKRDQMNPLERRSRDLPTLLAIDYVNRQGDPALMTSAKPYLQRLSDEKNRLDAVLVIPADALTNADAHLKFYSRSATDFMTQERLTSLTNAEVHRYRLKSRGISPDEADALLQNMPVDSVQLSKSGQQKKGGAANFFVGFILTALLFFPSFAYGLEIMRGIVQEKSDRVVEILISSMTPTQLLVGKIAGVAAVGLTQVGVWLGMLAVVGAYGAASAAVAGMNVLEMVRPVTFVYFVIFFVLAYLTYVCIYAVTGAICNSDKEAQQMVAPITMIMMLPWFLMVGIITSPDSKVSVAFSLAPVFGPMVMYIRTLVADPPLWHIALSIAISLVTIAVFFWATAKIFRVGILSYGKRPTIPELWRWLKVA